MEGLKMALGSALRCHVNVCSGSTATKSDRSGYVRFPPGGDQIADIPERQLRAKNRSGVSYSITSSARASRVGAIIKPSAFAVFRLMVRLNSVGCSTGRSAGFAPRKILST